MKSISVLALSAVAALKVDREPLLTWKPKAPASHPVDYFVPNFGKDHDIAASQSHEKAAERSVGHNWNPTKDEDDKWVLPSPTIEFKLNDDDRYPVFDFVQTRSDREPLLSWKPKAPSSHPVDYFVPDFGMDHDIKSTQDHEKAASQRIGHNWQPQKDDDGNWVLPSAHVEFKLRPGEKTLWDH